MMVVGSIEPGDIEVASRDGAVVASIAGPGRQSDPRISPDGKWLAYESNETGRAEIYVQPFPRLDHKYPISSEGGREPVWSHDGRELFFRNGDRMMVVTVGAGTTFSAEPPRVLFSGMFRYASDNAGGSYDVARDGRFLAIATSPPEIHVVVNFAAELERTVPR
jgi:dipeptidyl aminopeptidase/acylaminoacyl peptidase